MDASTIVYGLLLAILGTAALILVPNIPFFFSRRRLFRRFAQLRCGSCQTPFGLEAVRSGTDVSPFEELWSDGKADHIHCHPTCLQVKCPHCRQSWVLRYNNQGDRFGPELTMKKSEITEQTRCTEPGASATAEIRTSRAPGR